MNENVQQSYKNKQTRQVWDYKHPNYLLKPKYAEHQIWTHTNLEPDEIQQQNIIPGAIPFC